MDADARHSLDAIDAQRVLANVSEGLFGREVAPAKMDRFVLLDKLGSGGMGVVYSAFDPQLDRRVAIKVLHREIHGDPSQGSAQLLREARALAKLSHPNVVTVYEVGTVEDRVFLAMELVDGQPLNEWLDQPRGWQEIVQVFSQAGRGLAAAHTQGVVHQDFKPHNVVLGEDGRATVLDFGLARTEHVPLTVDSARVRAGITTTDTQDETRSLAGTPRYMSPEQFDRGAVDGRSDQFSFCVALYEALYRERPFEGETLAELSMSVCAGEVRTPRNTSDAPSWLLSLVRRGLDVDPAKRFASMSAVLLALEGPPRPWWRRPTLWAAAASAGVMGVLAWPDANAATPCTGGEQRVATAWGDEQRDATRTAFEATGLTYAEDARRGATEALDDYAQRWASAYHDACAATRIRGDQSEVLLDRRMICLRERLESLDAMAALLARADTKVVDRAALASRSLPDLEPCADAVQLLSEGRRLSPEALQQRSKWRRAIARAIAKRHTGKYAAARVDIEGVLAELADSDDLLVRAEANLELAIVQEKMGEYEASAATARLALWEATQQDEPGVQARAATLLVTVEGWQLRQAAQGHDWGRLARAVIARMGDPIKPISLLESGLANLSYSEGDLSAAVEHGQKSLTLREQILSPGHPRLATLHSHLGMFLGATGDTTASLEHHQRAVELSEQALGKTHPKTALIYNSLAGQLRRVGKFEESEAIFERLRTQWLEALGPDHIKVAMVDNNQANTMAAAGKFSEAVPYYRDAIRIWTKSSGSHEIRLAHARTNLGLVLVELGQPQQGLTELEQALRLHAAKLGDDHPETAPARINISLAHHALGRPALALEHAEAATRIVLKARSREHEEYPQARAAEAKALTSLGRLDEAIAAYQDAAEVFAMISTSATSSSNCYFQLAQRLVERGRDEDRVSAGRWAHKALETARDGDTSRPEQVATIAKWIADNTLTPPG
ncbi:MAG: tetratricopeptide repeat protein [Deltaproteobacteria bacterium]|nr:tetratricopeptide repeat protein [Deltaproteobacteria bacterium]